MNIKHITHATEPSVEDTLRSEIHALEHENRMALQELDKLKAKNERLNKLVRDAYEEGRDYQDELWVKNNQATGSWRSSTARARLEGRSE